MHGLIELLNEEIHVVATPVAPVLEAVGILLELCIIGNGQSCHRIGIEVVVHVNTVYIVAGDNVMSYFTDIVTILGNARV